MERVPMDQIKRIVHSAVAEDVGSGDATSLATIPEEVQAKAFMIAREPLIVSGLEIAETVFHEISPGLRVRILEKEADRAPKGSVLMEIEGSARAILTGERVALNFVQRLSGVA